MCKEPRIIFRPYSGESLCERCFRESVLNAVRTTISKFDMLHHTDRIAVAYSGGKDSLVLLSILLEIQERFPKSELIAITLEEGSQQDYKRRSTLEQVTRLLKVEHVTSSYQDLFSLTLDEIVDSASNFPSALSPCAYCGTLRRQGLNILARKIDANKLALGHNLDDEVQSMLMNLIRGDVQRLRRISPLLKGTPGLLVPRVKPLYHLLTFTKLIQTLDAEEQLPYQQCQVCGEITSRNICSVCLYRQQLGTSAEKADGSPDG